MHEYTIGHAPPQAATGATNCICGAEPPMITLQYIPGEWFNQMRCSQCNRVVNKFHFDDGIDTIVERWNNGKA